ncbi:iron-sulfur cluster assembly scaffold protein [Sphingomonas sp.]|uniref:iron-sulfur cluster assembly scaffold protein n=1 Tax=Sphingomonas sp. TaxID=28214 RepID=UPI00286B605B|nr:iron-sulfur cluster assembly scaffold protein [Sphingomonas sp.]
MSEPLYTRDILRLATSIPHLGALDRADGHAELRSPTCGSRVAASVRMEDGRVAALGQSVEACAFGQASAALMGAHAVGRSRAEVAQALAELTDWLTGKRVDPGNWPGLAVLAPALPKIGRHGAILLPFRALLAAISAS